MPRTPTILICDDDDGVMTVTALVLARRGYRVLQASDASQAIELAAAATLGVDLLIADLQLPDLPGQQLAAQLRAAHPGLRVLFVTGFVQDRANLEDEGARLLEKPFTPDALVGRVQELLDRGSREATADQG